MLEQSILMVPRLLLNAQMIWNIFIKILKNTTQIKNKILIIFDNMIADMFNNTKLNPVVSVIQ